MYKVEQEKQTTATVFQQSASTHAGAVEEETRTINVVEEIMYICTYQNEGVPSGLFPPGRDG